MSELAKFLDRNKLAKPSASSPGAALSRPIAPTQTAISRPVSERCYTQGYCSSTGARTFYVCEQKLKNGSLEWTAVDVVLADQKLAGTGSAAAVHKSDAIHFHVPPGLTCPSCRIRIKSNINLGGQTYSGGGFVCPCGAHNCFGGHKVVGGNIFTECGKCHAVGMLSPERWDGTAPAVRETQSKPSVGGSASRSTSTQPAPSMAAGAPQKRLK